MSTILSFNNVENNHDVYRGKGCMKKLCESLREHAKKVKLLTKEQQESYENAKIYYIYKQKFKNNYVTDKKIL